MPVIRTQVRPATEVECWIEHQFDTPSTVRTRSDNPAAPAQARPGRAGAERAGGRRARHAVSAGAALEICELLLDRAEHGRIARIGEQAKRMPEAEGGLHRAGVGSNPRAWAYARHPRAQMAPKSGRRRRHRPVPHSPRSKSQNGWSTRAVSQSMTPVSRSSSASSWSSWMSPWTRTGRSRAAAASRSAHAGSATGPAQALGGLGGRDGAGGRVERPAQPAMMNGVVVSGRTCPGQRGRLQLMPAGDGLAELLEEMPRARPAPRRAGG